MSRARRGATTLEAAVVLPVVFLLCLGTFDLCWLLFQRTTLQSAAAAGARAAASEDRLGEVQLAAGLAVNEELAAFGVPPGSVVTLASVEPAPGGRVLQVALRYRYEPLLGILDAREISAVATTPYLGWWYAPDRR
jgi:uncharacterized membrane protein